MLLDNRDFWSRVVPPGDQFGSLRRVTESENAGATVVCIVCTVHTSRAEFMLEMPCAMGWPFHTGQALLRTLVGSGRGTERGERTPRLHI